MAVRHHLDGLPYYCQQCGGNTEGCKRTDCTLETVTAAIERRNKYDNGVSAARARRLHKAEDKPTSREIALAHIGVARSHLRVAYLAVRAGNKSMATGLIENAQRTMAQAMEEMGKME